MAHGGKIDLGPSGYPLLVIINHNLASIMTATPNTSNTAPARVLVLGGTGKTGRRVAARLEAKGISVRIGSRRATPAFDWNNEATWEASLEGIDAVYITYAPDLAMPGATDAIQAFVNRAAQRGVRRLVLLSGRGEAEAQASERIVQESGLEWTVVRASWFFQNFSEGAFVEMVHTGQITLPAGEIPEPFVDVDDIADVATAALSEPGHTGQVYEVTGPRMLTFAEVAAELSKATGRPIDFIQVPHDAFVEGAKASGAPKEVVWMLDYLFSTVLDGRNAYLTDGVQRALGRAPKDFATYAAETALTGVWQLTAEAAS
ncbi:MAG: NAD(P)H-binding protein [Rhodothermales bacterium]